MEIKPFIAETTLRAAQQGIGVAIGAGAAAATAAVFGAPVLAAVAVTATYMAVTGTVTLVANQIINRAISQDKPVTRLVASLAAAGGAIGAGIGAAVAVVALTPLSISVLAGVGITLAALITTVVVGLVFKLCIGGLLLAYAHHSDANRQQLWRLFDAVGLKRSAEAFAPPAA